MIYLDNSSTTFKKPFSVKLATINGLTKYSVNPSRASYKLALKVSEKIYNCRELFATYFNTTAENVIFTSGCTMAINLALTGSVKRNGHIIATVFEHNSVLRTLEKLKYTYNITYTLIKPNKSGEITNSEITKHQTNRQIMQKVQSYIFGRRSTKYRSRKNRYARVQY